MRGKINFHYLNTSGKDVVISFSNADYGTSQEDLINAATIVGSSVITEDSDGFPSPLEFRYATGTIETVLAESN